MTGSVAEDLDQSISEILPVKRIYPVIFPIVGSFFERDYQPPAKGRIEVHIFNRFQANSPFQEGNESILPGWHEGC